MATSVGGVFTGRGGEYLIIDDPLKPDQALSEAERTKANHWFDHTLQTRLNDKRGGRIILIMQRLHEDDPAGHLLAKEKDGWTVLRFPAIAEENETHTVLAPMAKTFTHTRLKGEALHPEREDLALLEKMKIAMGEYNFAGQYQQSPAPAGGGLIKESWFKTYTEKTRPEEFSLIFQSWDTANKVTELSDYSVCTTYGVLGPKVYLLNVYRKKMDYPTLKRAVKEQAYLFGARTVLIEDRASGTQLIQDLIYGGMHCIQAYLPAASQDKIMRMNSCTPTIENGFFYVPESAIWLGDYKHEMLLFPHGKNDDQVDSTSQALDWIKRLHEQPTVTFYTVCI